MTEGSITTRDGVRLDYTDSGTPGGRPVVLVAGFKAARQAWLFQTPALEAAGYRVISVDLRGHGSSERPDFGHSMARRAADLDDLLTQLDLRRVVLVGQSMGGNTVWAYLRDFGAARIAGIVIVDQTPKMLNSDDWPFGYYGYTAENADTFFAESIPNTGHGTPLWRRGMRLVRLLRAMRSSMGGAKGLTAGELELLGDHARADWRSVIAGSVVPTLFVAGAESEMWPSGHAAAAAALSPSATSVVIEHDGHAANIEQPEKFNDALLTFLAGL